MWGLPATTSGAAEALRAVSLLAVCLLSALEVFQVTRSSGDVTAGWRSHVASQHGRRAPRATAACEGWKGVGTATATTQPPQPWHGPTQARDCLAALFS